jgi:peptidoglycan/xylan/chitin deacetylase (PgdA/CDA1 family)
MAAQVLITVDTELSSSSQRRGMPVARNFERSFLGRTAAGEFGVPWQMEVLAAHGLKGVYFVDPMPGLVHGAALVEDMVGPILAAGHEVQLHLHTEWLEWVRHEPVGRLRGRNLADFPLHAQSALLKHARALLHKAGAPWPVAFRAGNFGANDDTLAALASLGFHFDSSFNPAWTHRDCRISLPLSQIDPVEHHGVTEVPVAALFDGTARLRPAQVCALSAREMKDALHHAAEAHDGLFTVVTHSFEMLSRDRLRPNRMVMQRFESLCRTIAEHPGLSTCGFIELDARRQGTRQRLAHSWVRTAHRMAEQAWAHWRYERPWAAQ